MNMKKSPRESYKFICPSILLIDKVTKRQSTGKGLPLSYGTISLRIYRDFKSKRCKHNLLFTANYIIKTYNDCYKLQIKSDIIISTVKILLCNLVSVFQNIDCVNKFIILITSLLETL